jgi:hypothetical protein
MDPTHIRCKDLKPKIPDAFERLRAQSSTKSHSVVAAWLPELPLPKSSRRHPLREIQQSSLNNTHPIAACTKRSPRHSGAYRVQRIMADKNTQVQTKRGRGRPRGSRGLCGRGRNIGQPRDTFGTDRMTPDEDTVTGESDPFVDVPSALVLRPVESQSSSSRRSPTRKAAAIVKKGQLAFIEPAIRFVSHEKATERGGLPPVVKDLWERHLHPTLDLSQFLPLGLEVSVPSLG